MKIKKLAVGRKKMTGSEIERGKRLANAIQSSRTNKGLSQQELAIKACIGIDTLRSIECARVFSPSFFTISDIAIALGEDLRKWQK